jgi:hypothetical protein
MGHSFENSNTAFKLKNWKTVTLSIQTATFYKNLVLGEKTCNSVPVAFTQYIDRAETFRKQRDTETVKK